VRVSFPSWAGAAMMILIFCAHSGQNNVQESKKTLGGNARIPRVDLGLVVQNHVQQGIMDLDFSVVDKT
jgi:hypothetical protein